MLGSAMKHYGGNLSHRKHRSACGGPTRGHRAEIALIVNDKRSRRAEPLFPSLAELFGNVSLARRRKPRVKASRRSRTPSRVRS